MTLRSSNPDTDPEDITEAFALLHLMHEEVKAFFEHGQWWVQATIGDEQETFSVVDAVGKPDTVCDGLSFEQIE